MGKKTKIGKQRKDKFYQLAKESGYRSRAAFKLIQLNRKFEFLQKSRVCIDLCAAPGGWMQVARQNMPVSSIVIGVDLFPIKTIPGCISLVEDITMDKCRSSISKELKAWKADIVLNDGAPNLGTNWLHDAYQQCALTLSAIKLASHFLRRGGWFVTKIFRSKDYHSILFVLQQLFKRVHVTKPQASRSESAEIFIVCQYYLAPDKVDPKFFDAKYVFSELDINPTNKLNLLHPEKRKLKPQGYPENDYTLYHSLSAEKFIAHPTGIELLQEASEIIIDDPQIVEHAKTTTEIRECCKDIKVLNRKDIRLLLAWQKELHNEFHIKPAEQKRAEAANELKQNENDNENAENKEEAEIDTAIAELREENRRELKKKKKKIQKARQKLNEKLNLKMIHIGDEGPRLTDGDDMFNLREIKSLDILEKVTDQTPDILADSDSDTENVMKSKPKRIAYQKDEGHLDSTGLYYKTEESESETPESDDENEEDLMLDSSEEEDDVENDKSMQNSSNYDDDVDDDDDELKNPLMTDLDQNDKSTKKINKAKMWFEKESFKNIEKDSDEEYELEKMVEVYKKKGKAMSDGKKDNNTKSSTKNQAEDSDSDYNVEENFFTKKENHRGQKNNEKDDKAHLTSKEIPKPQNKRKLNAEDLALGTLLSKSKKSRRDIIDAAWNRYAFNDEHLPDWFMQDEVKHMKKTAPVTKELVEDYKKALININARPIKKVMEAKARKKKRTLRKLEKAKKKVEALMDNADITEREKADQIKKLYKSAKRQPKKEVTYVVSKKHLAQKRASRPAGVKGRYRVVDPRMKKDLRAAKAKDKTKGRGKKGRAHGRPAAKLRKSKKSK